MREYSSWIGVIDDDPSVRRALGRMIRLFGFETKLFASASDYLNESHSEPACLIVDIVMPEVNGLELLAELQASEIGRASCRERV
jgi:FixJ family two-component response regulator